MPAPAAQGFFRRRLALPTEHGAWSWWLAPWLVGAVAGGAFTLDAVLVFVLALTAFLAHQPATVAVKAATGRGPRADLRPALAWLALQGALAAAALVVLLWGRHVIVLLPVLAGLVLFPLHLGLVARRAERRQLGFELVGAAALALWAPAAYVVGRGEAASDARVAFLLWLLMALHSAGAILTVYTRLTHRTWKQVPSLAARLRTAAPTLVLHAAALALAVLLFPFDRPSWAMLAFLLVFADAVHAALNPRVDAMPRQLGFWQLAVTAVFTLLMIAAVA